MNKREIESADTGEAYNWEPEDYSASDIGGESLDSKQQAQIKRDVIYWVWMLCWIQMPIIGVVVCYWKKSKMLLRGLSISLYCAFLSWAWVTTAWGIVTFALRVIRLFAGMNAIVASLEELFRALE